MKLFKSTLPFSALGIVFITLGLIMSDPRQFGFGVVWFLIAAAKTILTNRKEEADQIN